MQWLDRVLQDEYSVVSVLRNTDKITIRHLRHKRLAKDLVCLSFEGNGAVYRLLQTICHENLPRVYEVCEENGRCTILEEFIDGTTVAQILKSGLYNADGVRAVMTAVCDAVGYLHSVGIVHRDIKPENVMVTSEGRVVLLDFDTARYHKPTAARDTVVIGTAGYAAPEQFGVAQTDNRADIFAMGIMMNVMLTGEHPTKRMADGNLRRIIEKCTRLDPAGRYPDVWALKKALKD